MDLGLHDKVAAVAAASSGLGKASALELAREGARVAICGRNEARLRQAAEDIRQATGSEVLPIVADVTDPEEARRFIEQTAEHWGRLDIVVTNAGGPPAGLFEDFDEKDWLDAFNLNFLSTQRLIKAALPHLKKAGSGRIIAITSVSAKQVLDNLVLSNAVRAGVHGLIKTLAQELGPYNITVNAVCPGPILTERLIALFRRNAEAQGITFEEAQAAWVRQIPLGRLGKPEEFGPVVAFLASERASFINGVLLQVDGGMVKAVM
ncbi:MAG: SDR family oxidoreductase [Chloroflexi bacterium]|nr:SDR family oxidoreductase [Chloroflexota bacterium]